MLAELAAVFARFKVSVEQVIQKKKQSEWAELVIITEEVKKGIWSRRFRRSGRKPAPERFLL